MYRSKLFFHVGQNESPLALVSIVTYFIMPLPQTFPKKSFLISHRTYTTLGPTISEKSAATAVLEETQA